VLYATDESPNSTTKPITHYMLTNLNSSKTKKTKHAYYYISQSISSLPQNVTPDPFINEFYLFQVILIVILASPHIFIAEYATPFSLYELTYLFLSFINYDNKIKIHEAPKAKDMILEYY